MTAKFQLVIDCADPKDPVTKYFDVIAQGMLQARPLLNLHG